MWLENMQFFLFFFLFFLLLAAGAQELVSIKLQMSEPAIILICFSSCNLVKAQINVLVLNVS